tara:strand:+ start:970 stop:1830 length:861 start_codon:yes stop_codon:yes gene_type:complete
LNLKVRKGSDLIAWPHRIVDNFFSTKELSWLEGQFEYGLKELKKKYWPLFDEDENMLGGDELQEQAHKHRIITPTTATNGFSCFVPFWSTERYIEVIDDIWREASKLYKWNRNNDIRRKDYFSFLELNIYPPHLNYGWHVDIDYKTFTGVIYIGETGDGTTLKSSRNELDVIWKHNRGLFFMNCDKERRMIVKQKRQDGLLDECDKYTSLHRYQNKGDDVRYAVNMNIVHIDNIGQMINKGIIGPDTIDFSHKTRNPNEYFLDRTYKKFNPILLGFEPPRRKRRKK